jgi:hypothetical protein
MCTDLGPELQETAHAQLLPALMRVMEDFSAPRVQAHVCAAVVNFSESVDSDILHPYLDQLIRMLVALLQVRAGARGGPGVELMPVTHRTQGWQSRRAARYTMQGMPSAFFQELGAVARPPCPMRLLCLSGERCCEAYCFFWAVALNRLSFSLLARRTARRWCARAP